MAGDQVRLPSPSELTLWGVFLLLATKAVAWYTGGGLASKDGLPKMLVNRP